jgi:hypothetical protein
MKEQYLQKKFKTNKFLINKHKSKCYYKTIRKIDRNNLIMNKANQIKTNNNLIKDKIKNNNNNKLSILKIKNFKNLLIILILTDLYKAYAYI